MATVLSIVALVVALLAMAYAWKLNRELDTARGRLDRYNRALLLFLCSLVGVAGMIALPFAITFPILAYAVVLVWGGITGGLYTIGLTHLGSRFRGIDLASANAMFVTMYALGMIVGPAIGGVSMQKAGPAGLAWFLAVVFAAYAVVAAWRAITRRSAPAA